MLTYRNYIIQPNMHNLFMLQHKNAPEMWLYKVVIATSLVIQSILYSIILYHLTL